MNQFDRYRVPAEGENMPTTEEGIPGVMARNGGIAMKTGGALSAAARQVQAAGKGEDKILVHINPDEYAELVRKHGPAIRNEDTGLPQLGLFKKLGKILKIAAPVILSVALPGVGTAVGTALGATGTMASVLGNAIVGAGVGGITGGKKGALMGAIGGGLGGYAQGASGLGGLSPEQYKNLTFGQKLMVGNRLGALGATDPAKAILQAPATTAADFSMGRGMNFVDPSLAAKFSPATTAATATQSPGFFDTLGKTLTTGLMGTPNAEGLPGLLNTATSPLGLALMALSAKKPSDQQVQFPTVPGAPSQGQGVAPFAPVAPTLEQMRPVQPTTGTQTVSYSGPSGRTVTIPVEQYKVLQDFAQMQNVYNPMTFRKSGGPVYARTGGLSQAQRYADGGKTEQVRVALTPDEIKAQGIDVHTFGEKPLPANFSFFKYTNAPKPAPTTPAPTTPATTTPAKTDPNPVYDDQGRVIAANVDVSRYWDPQTGQYLGNWRGIDNYLREMGTTPTQTATDAPTYRTLPAQIDSDYWSSFKKGGALSRYVKGEGDGQEDKIPAMLSDGEYVMDAETVSAIGNGSSEAGAKKLDEFRMNLRKHKRSAPIGKIPPKTKHLSKYMSGGSR